MQGLAVTVVQHGALVDKVLNHLIWNLENAVILSGHLVQGVAMVAPVNAILYNSSLTTITTLGHTVHGGMTSTALIQVTNNISIVLLVQHKAAYMCHVTHRKMHVLTGICTP